MVEYKKKESSGVAKTALGLGIGALGLQALTGGTGLPFLGGAVPRAFAAEIAGCGYVTDKDMGLIREIGAKDAEISTLKSERYTDGQIACVNAEICALKAALAMETERRACGDVNLQTYIDGNYIKAEKGLNSKVINYHGCEPVIRPVHDCCCN